MDYLAQENKRHRWMAYGGEGPFSFWKLKEGKVKVRRKGFVEEGGMFE